MRRWQGWILNKGGRLARNLLAILYPGLKSGATNTPSLRDEEKGNGIFSRHRKGH